MLDAFSTRLPPPASRAIPSSFGRVTMAHRHYRRLPPPGPSAMPVRGAARSARCWKEISAHPASSAGRVRLPAVASATRSSRSSISSRRWPASPAARSRPIVLMAVKWRNYKLHLDWPRPRRRGVRGLVFPARLQSRVRSEGAFQHHLAEYLARRRDRTVRGGL